MAKKWGNLPHKCLICQDEPLYENHESKYQKKIFLWIVYGMRGNKLLEKFDFSDAIIN